MDKQVRTWTHNNYNSELVLYTSWGINERPVATLRVHPEQGVTPSTSLAVEFELRGGKVYTKFTGWMQLGGEGHRIEVPMNPLKLVYLRQGSMLSLGPNIAYEGDKQIFNDIYCSFPDTPGFGTPAGKVHLRLRNRVSAPGCNYEFEIVYGFPMDAWTELVNFIAKSILKIGGKEE